jgi:DNA-binding MarR family transcriptional regulator/GNAT superfamily N-acetyltransferase
MPAAMVEQVRRFNRAVTQRVGALDDRYLARERPLGEARVLWEIGLGGCEVRTLRARLGLDSGHASRLLRALEGAGMVTVVQAAHDRRVRLARLTLAGRAEWALIDRRSDELAASFLAPLSEPQRERLVGAMREVERLLTAATVEIVPVDPEHPDARQCLRSYFAELERRSGAPFDPLVGSTAEPHELRPPAGEMVVVYLRDEPVGCGALKHFDSAVTDIKRMWLAESARGLGLGRRLLETLERRAAEAGARTVRLETSALLDEAIGLYRSAGYREVPAFNDEPFAHHWFAKSLPQEYG